MLNSLRKYTDAFFFEIQNDVNLLILSMITTKINEIKGMSKEDTKICICFKIALIFCCIMQINS